MNLEQLIEQTIAGLGYELVDLERAANGLIRVFMDDAKHERDITVEDCEAASRQLTYVFEVENVNYERMEVSSPGIDRPLKKLSDFVRFAGSEASVKLKLPMNGRKNFTGTIQAVNQSAPETEQLSMVYKQEGAEQVLTFGLVDVNKARLVPVYNLKKKKK